MDNRPFGPHDFGSSPLWLTALLTGFSLLLWLGPLALLAWASLPLFGRRRPAPQPVSLIEPSAPSAAELLRRRYVLGQIDANTFERMLERVMFSEAFEASGQRLAPRRVRIWEPETEPSLPTAPPALSDDAELL